MKKLFYLSFIFLTILNPNLYSQNETHKYAFSIEEFNLQYNNHVGNDWAYGVNITLDGQEYSLSKFSRNPLILDINYNSELEIIAIAQEQDTYPDTGYDSFSLNIQELFMNVTYEIELFITVTEDKGRYAGNTAEWKCVVLVEKVE